jgi:hypothetical protein
MGGYGVALGRCGVRVMSQGVKVSALSRVKVRDENHGV